MKPINHIGEQFGRWTVLKVSNKRKHGQLCFICRCDCGTEKAIAGSMLRGGRSKSCGCLRRDLGVARGKSSRKHGEGSNGKETPEYRAWSQMKTRCQNINHKQYVHYGGRGITVCDHWQTYENFLADMGRRPDQFHSLDRIDNNGPYSPENCRWATWQQQNNNKRQRGEWCEVTLNGETKPLAQWLRQYGITRNAYDKRRGRGLSIEEAICKPLQHKAPLGSKV